MVKYIYRRTYCFETKNIRSVKFKMKNYLNPKSVVVNLLYDCIMNNYVLLYFSTLNTGYFLTLNNRL